MLLGAAMFPETSMAARKNGDRTGEDGGGWGNERAAGSREKAADCGVAIAGLARCGYR